MRALFLLAAATMTVAACTAGTGSVPVGHASASHGSPSAAPAAPSAAAAATPMSVGCDQVILHVTDPGGRLELGRLSVPPARMESAATTGTRPWSYFAKWGIAIRASSPAVLITVAVAGRGRAAISWGNGLGVTSSQRLPSCPRQGGAWNVYAGGFYLKSPSGCVPLVFQVGQRTTTLTFAIGKSTCDTAS